MSNKSQGTAFEKEFAELLSENGFWVHCLKDNQNGQPFDVIAARSGFTYVFDCKDCQGDTFRLDRIEENQHCAMSLWAATGNTSGMFAIRMSGTVYMIPHRILEILQENGTKQIGHKDLVRYGMGLNRWLEAKDKLHRR